MAAVESEWVAGRRAAARVHETALSRLRAAEAVQAKALLTEFAGRLTAAGVPTERLTAAGYGDGRAYRTDVVGWYLRANRSLGIDAEGRYYVLQTPGGWAARFKGVHLEPDDPPLVIGRGARDGESVGLKDLLALRLAELTGGGA